MRVSIKELNIPLNIGTSGTKIQVSAPHGKHIGYLIVNKTGVTWLNGKEQSGKCLEWNDLIRCIGESGK
jgi:hypothetical protein